MVKLLSNDYGGKRRWRIVCLTLVVVSCLVAASQLAPLPFYDDFEDGDFAGWSVTDDPGPQGGPSDWVILDGMLAQRSNIWSYGPVELETKYHLGTHITTGEDDWDDYTINAVVRSNDNDGLGLIARYQDKENYYRVLLMNDPVWSGRDSSGASVNTPLQRIQKFVDGEPVILAENKVSSAYPDGYFALTMEVRGDAIRAYLDGELILSAVDSDYATGRIGMLSYANQGTYYDDVSVTREHMVYDPPDRSITFPVRRDRAPYIQRPTQSSVEIAWRTLEPGVGRVAYGIEKGALDEEVEEDGERQKHHVLLDQLLPSTRYFYSVYTDGTAIVQEENFRTARRHDETEFSFLVIGDSGVDTPTQHAVAAQMRASTHAKEADFIVHVGDVHQGSGDDYDAVYFTPYRDLIKNMNVFTSLGNHDVQTANGGVYLDDFYLPNNNPAETERYYSFRWANAFFICLDTNSDYAPGSAQHDFLLSALEDPLRQEAEWTFVYAHHPPYTEYWTDYYGDEHVQEHLVPVFEEYDVDLAMNGHTHSYERGEREHVHYLVSGGGGGGLDDFFVDYDHVSFSDAVHHFTRIDVDGDQLLVTAIDQEGAMVDRFTIHKNVEVSRLDDERPVERLELDQTYPNPTAEEARIGYTLPSEAAVELELYDVTGRLMATLVDRRQPAGRYEVVLDVRHLVSGTYVYRLTANDQSMSRQLTIQR